MGYVYPAYGFCVCVAVEVEYVSYRENICTGCYFLLRNLDLSTHYRDVKFQCLNRARLRLRF